MVALFLSVLSSPFGPGVSRGFGFISYDTFEASDAALAGMNGCGAKKRKGVGRKRKESLDFADCPADWKQRCRASGITKVQEMYGNVHTVVLAPIQWLQASTISFFDWMPMTRDPHVSGRAILFSAVIYCKYLWHPSPLWIMNAWTRATCVLVMTLRQFLCNRPISVSYAYKKETKGERLDMARHGQTWPDVAGTGWRLANLQCAMSSTCVNLKKREECIYGFIHIPELEPQKTIYRRWKICSLLILLGVISVLDSMYSSHILCLSSNANHIIL